MPLLILLPVAGLILGWRRFFGGRVGSATLHAVAAVVLFLYVSAFVGLLRPMTIAVLTVGTVLLAWHFFRVIRDSEPVADDAPLYMLIGLSVLVWLVHRNGFFLFYDEYSHWGIFLREMLYLNGFWNADTGAIHPRYLPGATLWQYLFVKFTDDRDGVAYLAQFVLLMAPLIVLWQNLSLRQLPWFLGIVALLILGLTNFGHGVASLYVDHLLAAWLAGLILNFVCDIRIRRPAELVSYVLPLAAIALIKGPGLFLALASVVIFAALLLIGARRTVSDGERGSATSHWLALVLIWLAAPVLVSTSWTLNRDAAGAAPELYSTSQLVAGLARGDSVLDPDEEAELSRRFRHVVIHQQLSKNQALRAYDEFSYPIMEIFTDPFRLTTLSFLVIWIVWQVVVLQWFVQPGDRLTWSVTGTGLLLASLIYIGFLYLSFRFAFGENGLRLPSYLRYVHTVVLPLLLIGFAPLLPAFRKQSEADEKTVSGTVARPASLLFLCGLSALYVLETPHLVPLFRANGELAFRHLTAPLTERIRNIVSGDRIWIYLPVEDPNGLLDKIVRFQLSPAHVEIESDPQYFESGKVDLPDAWRDQDYLWFPLEHPQVDEIVSGHIDGGMGQRLIRVTRLADTVVLGPPAGVPGNP